MRLFCLPLTIPFTCIFTWNLNVIAIVSGLDSSIMSTSGTFSLQNDTPKSSPRKAYGTRLRNVPCSFCERQFANKRDLEGHINSAHLNIKPYSCEICLKEFAGKKTLNNHKKVCTFKLSVGQELSSTPASLVDTPDLPGVSSLNTPLPDLPALNTPLPTILPASSPDVSLENIKTEPDEEWPEFQ